jgi:hypothetical protein
VIPDRWREDYDPLADDELELDRRDAAREPPPPAPATFGCARCRERWCEYILGERGDAPGRCERCGSGAW